MTVVPTSSFIISDTTRGVLEKMGLASEEIGHVATVCENRDKTKHNPRKEDIWAILAKIVYEMDTVGHAKPPSQEQQDVQQEVQKEDPNESFHSTGSQTEKQAQADIAKEKGERICSFYRRGLCKFGNRGKNKEGSCPFKHPPKCPKFVFGGPTSLGCRWKGCPKLHPNVCQAWRSGTVCSAADCKQLHPTVPSDKANQKNLPPRLQAKPEVSRPHPWQAQEIEPKPRVQQQQQTAGLASSQAFLEDRLKQMEATLLEHLTVFIKTALQQQTQQSPRAPLGPPPGYPNAVWTQQGQMYQRQ